MWRYTANRKAEGERRKEILVDDDLLLPSSFRLSTLALGSLVPHPETAPIE
jgi:hypothetical protein